MRNVFCNSLLELAWNPAFVFLTGDLGFQALEPLRAGMGARFINAGVGQPDWVLCRPSGSVVAKPRCNAPATTLLA